MFKYGTYRFVFRIFTSESTRLILQRKRNHIMIETRSLKLHYEL